MLSFCFSESRNGSNPAPSLPDTFHLYSFPNCNCGCCNAVCIGELMAICSPFCNTNMHNYHSAFGSLTITSLLKMKTSGRCEESPGYSDFLRRKYHIIGFVDQRIALYGFGEHIFLVLGSHTKRFGMRSEVRNCTDKPIAILANVC